jgi:hypothetical protein
MKPSVMLLAWHSRHTVAMTIRRRSGATTTLTLPMLPSALVSSAPRLGGFASAGSSSFEPSSSTTRYCCCDTGVLRFQALRRPTSWVAGTLPAAPMWQVTHVGAAV